MCVDARAAADLVAAAIAAAQEDAAEPGLPRCTLCDASGGASRQVFACACVGMRLCEDCAKGLWKPTGLHATRNRHTKEIPLYSLDKPDSLWRCLWCKHKGLTGDGMAMHKRFTDEFHSPL
jgi:hypothetical protein